MTTVFIKGLGLIGSSIARVIKQTNPNVKIIGSDQNTASLHYALNHQVIDETSNDLELAGQADFIFLATPVDQIIADIETLARQPLRPNVIVTDVGSTKQTVMKAAAILAEKKVTFVGGHPMAGSHKTGVRAGTPNLFENAFYFQIPTGTDGEVAARKIQKLLQVAKAKWLTVTPKQHDKIVAQISHIPHVIAAGLVNQTQAAFADEPMGMRLAAGGFKSITRIASADPQMWNDILLNNADLISTQLQQYLDVLTDIKHKIDQRDSTAIKTYFEKAKTSRDKLGSNHVGKIAGFYDLFLDLPDEVGVLADITQRLQQADINLVNLHILEIREDVNGVLQLTFRSEKDLQRAQELLAAKYSVTRRE
ncbi:prephenate dehydrogenase [Fructilactobacillus lindneri]|uniref:Prephenate dehydrogenase n=2 Tax=Fructilactobacillus lindneri TaxID=53444 RepID=A0A0R2JTW0_9LACO|nr:prephenate dehydrogenase [Fructilactobacillus lindneri]ANZ57490.1 prephenate dehydrogenase [Fructilactobacillus lindneri]ANZ58758.1 prephenate dehydrogenase [Fructilactobacillus lindneri]KRN80475.1 Prephenate dehydrogenase [Fructilactobacillus lindneri DSM 20690 = JCM 11027]POG97812.1 prephenate dehydrogenase [Fructilactobacillus lindneri]POG99145.1 prephenate dehydrogenase [Fructilactobacillus lindneri]